MSGARSTFAARWRRAASAVAVAVVAFIACGGDTTAPPVEGRRVLFVGNSLTYFNSLPHIVEALADSSGDSLRVSVVAFPGFALEDHWNRGDALDAIDGGGFDVVVLQQGPSSLESSRENLRLWTRNFDERIRVAGGRTALYMVWPSAQNFSTFDRVSESYRLAAEDVNGMLLPAGEAWRAAWRRDPDAPLYGPDDFHPSVPGSYLAALSIYGVLFDRTPVGLPPTLRLATGETVQLAPALAAVLQEAAAEANQTFGRP